MHLKLRPIMPLFTRPSLSLNMCGVPEEVQKSSTPLVHRAEGRISARFVLD
jgi:hypothetical protein